jgi:lauroyl/myristoyl acyltransferase
MDYTPAFMATEEAVIAAPGTEAPPRAPDLSTIDRIKFELVRGFLYAWARCFSLTGLYKFGQFFGLCEYLINHKRRGRFQRRLGEVFGDSLTPAQARRHTIRFFVRTRCDKLFYLIFDKLPKEKILKRLRFHRREVLDRELARGRGLYVTLSHHGSHHVAGLIMALMGYKMAGVRDRNEGPLRRYVQQRFEETFPEIRSIRVFFSDIFPRDLYRCLQEGYILASALDVERDRGPRLRRIPVQMFGRQREFLTGTMQIALRCGAPIMQGFVISRKNYYFHFHAIGPLVDPDQARDEPEIVQQTMQRYADNIAEHVRKWPCHLSGF